MDEKRNAEGKEHEKKIGEKGGAKAAKKVAGKNDGTEAKRDQELVLYEFLNMLVRISFQRANPTLGNFGSKAEVVHLPGCLEKMIVDEILPRSRRDTAMLFRETIYAEISVQAVIDEYRDKMRAWYKDVTANDKDANVITDKLTFEDWLRVCKDGNSDNANKPSGAVERNALVGVWRCHRESEVTGDPRTASRGTNYEWRLSIPQIKAAFMDSQGRDQMGAAQSSATDDMNVLDFEEFLECVARCGVDKYKGVKAMTPADGVRALMINMLGEAEEEEVVVRTTYIKADRWDQKNGNRMAVAIDGDTMVLEDVEPAKPLPSDKPGDFEKWMECWQRIEIMDMHMFPLWEKAVFDILQPLFKELQLIFLGYTRSISEDSAEDAMEMSLDEFHDFVVDVSLETKQYQFDVMSNQFVKANATNVAQVRAQRHEEKRNARSRGNDKPDWQKTKVGKVKSTSDGHAAAKDAELVLYEFLCVLVRVAFWRANPNFGLWVDKDGDGRKDEEEAVSVPLALTGMLNDVILPRAKRENSVAFREKEMADKKLLEMLAKWRPKLASWFEKNVGKAVGGKRPLLDFQTWLRLLDRQSIVGEWEVEQRSQVTGDSSTKGQIKMRLSIVTCKAAFMDSQRVEQLGVGVAEASSEQAALDFEEVRTSPRVDCCPPPANAVLALGSSRLAYICLLLFSADPIPLPYAHSGSSASRASPPPSTARSARWIARPKSMPFSRTGLASARRRIACTPPPTLAPNGTIS